MKIKQTRNLRHAIVSFELFNKLGGWDIAPETELSSVIEGINGDDARHWFKKLKTTCKVADCLSENCLYVFTYNKEGTALVPRRITMSYQTYANYSKGWRKYGSESIRA